MAAPAAAPAPARPVARGRPRRRGRAGQPRRRQLDQVRSTAELLGISLDELIRLAEDAKAERDVPTFADFMDRVAEVESVKRCCAKRKGPHFDFVARFGERTLDAVQANDIAVNDKQRAEAVGAAVP